MRILIAAARFNLAGTETYSVTLGEHLERLGHPVTLYAPEAAPQGRELADSYGLRLVVGEPPELDQVDAIVAQDAACSYLFAGRAPAVPQIFVVHGLALNEQPPERLEPQPAAVVLNDRTERHVGCLAARPTVVRLRQPIDIERFRPRGTARPRARRALLVSNYLYGERRRVLERVCDELGLELTGLGVSGKPTVAPQPYLADADIVIGYGRGVLEAMAMGRAAYVWDFAGGDGWVTPESYAALEADGFSGTGTDDIIDGDRLRADLAAYRPDLGTFGFDIVRERHSAIHHAEEIVELLGRAAPVRADDVLETLGLLVRAETRAANRANGLESEGRRVWADREWQKKRADEMEERLRRGLESRAWRAAQKLRRLAARRRRPRPSGQGGEGD
jgi:hypothetical protein